MMNHIENIKVKTNIDLDNNKVLVKIKRKTSLIETNCKINLENPETIKTIEQNIKEELNRIINESTYLVQKKYKTDVLGYGKIIHKKNPKKWKEIKNKWNEIFKNLKIETEIDLTLEEQGSLIQTIKEAK